MQRVAHQPDTRRHQHRDGAGVNAKGEIILSTDLRGLSVCNPLELLDSKSILSYSRRCLSGFKCAETSSSLKGDPATASVDIVPAKGVLDWPSASLLMGNPYTSSCLVTSSITSASWAAFQDTLLLALDAIGMLARTGNPSEPAFKHPVVISHKTNEPVALSVQLIGIKLQVEVQSIECRKRLLSHANHQP